MQPIFFEQPNIFLILKNKCINLSFRVFFEVQDLLRVRIATTGITETKFTIKKNEFRCGNFFVFPKNTTAM